ncbi:MAG: crossover junction endodeoxyribonuclease RuvC [Actinomycetota bacterium]
MFAYRSPTSSGVPVRVMGIDPGLTRLGYGVIEEAAGKMRALDAGVVATSKTSPLRLLAVFEQLSELMARWAPGEVAVERVFMKANQKTAIGAIQAAGIAQVTAGLGGAEVFEYAPAEVKQSVVGTGTADKNQVRFMVSRILGVEAPQVPDAADALAVAITHLHCRKLNLIGAAAR